MNFEARPNRCLDSALTALSRENTCPATATLCTARTSRKRVNVNNGTLADTIAQQCHNRTLWILHGLDFKRFLERGVEPQLFISWRKDDYPGVQKNCGSTPL